MDPREEKERAREADERKRAAEEARKKRAVLVVGMMKSGNPFQLALGEGELHAAAERVRSSLEKAKVEIIEGDALVVLRWAEMESAVVMTEAELERRQRVAARDAMRNR